MLAVYNIVARYFISSLSQVILIMATFALFVISVSLHYANEHDASKRQKIIRRSTLSLFFYYISLLIMVLFVSGFIVYRVSSGLNLVPFRTILRFINNNYYGMLFLPGNLAGNFILFAPMGFFLPLLFKPFKKWYVYTSVMLLAAVFVEATQYLTATGSADIDDVILNFSGAVFAYIIVRIAMRIWNKRKALKKPEHISG